MEREMLSREEKRDLRRKRRRKNTMTAFAAAAVLVVVLCISIFLLIKLLTGNEKEDTQTKEIEEQISQILEEEEAIPEEPEEIPPTPEELEAMEREENIASMIFNMTLEEKVAGLFMITPEALTGTETVTQAGDTTKAMLEKYPVGGLIYFKKNLESTEQVKDMISATLSFSKYPLFIAVDEEGGKVSRVAESLGEENVGPMANIGAGGDTYAAYKATSTIASYLTQYGFNVDFAPVADVVVSGQDSAIGDRAFGSDAAVVSSMVASAVKGLQENHVSACLKHFPGLGGTSEDTHLGMAETFRTKEEMEENEWKPFKAGISSGADFIMVGHISANALTGDNRPCSLSSAVMTDILRGEMGYSGIIITDALNMGAISEYYSSSQAAIMALKSGADMILMPENFKEAYEGVLEAVQNGTVSEERITDSLTRIYRVKMKL